MLSLPVGFPDGLNSSKTRSGSAFELHQSILRKGPRTPHFYQHRVVTLQSIHTHLLIVPLLGGTPDIQPKMKMNPQQVYLSTIIGTQVCQANS